MPPDALKDRVESRLVQRQKRNILRRLSDPSDLIDFSSNDYLGLAKHPALRARFLNRLHARENADAHVLGAGGSRLLDGNTAEHIELERRLAGFFGAPAALLHNSGYEANVGFFSCVPQAGDTILYDVFIHASVHDGMRASRVPASHRLSFEHNSVRSLRSLIVTAVGQDPALQRGDACLWVAVESLYSMDGDIAPLDLIVQTVEELLPLGNGHIIVDEAHATGIYGPQGRGLVAHLGLEDRVLVRLHTFGKALASNGAVLLTPPYLRDYLINYSRPLIYTTALAGYNAIAVQSSFDMLENGLGSQLSENLLTLALQLRRQLHEVILTHPTALAFLPFPDRNQDITSTTSSLISPIIPLLTPHPRELSRYLSERCGILARPIAHPTVPKGEERVRICVHANNTMGDVERLVEGVRAWIVVRSRSDGPEESATSLAGRVKSDILSVSTFVKPRL